MFYESSSNNTAKDIISNENRYFTNKYRQEKNLNEIKAKQI